MIDLSLLDLLFCFSVMTVAYAFYFGRKATAVWPLLLLYGIQILLLIMSALQLAEGHMVASNLHLTLLHSPMHWNLTGCGWFFASILLGIAWFCCWLSLNRKQQVSLGHFFHPMLALNVFVMLFLMSSQDLISWFVSWELLNWFSYLLFVQSNEQTSKAAFRLLLYGMIGSLFILVGLIVIQQFTVELDFTTLAAVLTSMSTEVMIMISLLFGGGFAIRIALLPFHLWQTESCVETPIPVVIMLTLFLPITGLFAFLLILVQLVGLERIDGLFLLSWLAAITALFASLISLLQHEVKQFLVWISIGQLGLLLLGITLATPMGITAALLSIVNYVLAQTALWLAIGYIVLQTRTTNLAQFGGLAARFPFSYFTVLIAVLGLAGLPPTNGFISRWFLYQALLDHQSPLLLMMAMLSMLITLLALYRLVNQMFWGQASASLARINDISLMAALPMLLLAVLVIVTGCFPGLTFVLIEIAQGSLGIATLDYQLTHIETPVTHLDTHWMLIVLLFVSVLIVLFQIRRLILKRRMKTAGFLPQDDHQVRQIADTPMFFYPDLARRISHWMPGNIQRLEQEIVLLVRLLAGMMQGVYHPTNGLFYLLIAAIGGILLLTHSY